MNWLKTLFTAFVLQATALLAAHADLADVQAADVFRMGTEGTYPPFTYHDDSGKLVGFDVDLGREVAKRLGVKAEFMEGRWDGLIAGLDANRYDAVINQVGITEERKAKYDFSEPYIAAKAALIVRDGDDDITGFADLQGKKAAQSLSSNYARIAEEAGADLVATEGFEQAIQLVVNRRADATINDSLSFYDFKKQRPNAPVKIAATEDDAAYSGIIVRKGQPDLVAAINKALEEIKADGTYKTLSEKYFGVDVSQ